MSMPITYAAAPSPAKASATDSHREDHEARGLRQTDSAEAKVAL